MPAWPPLDMSAGDVSIYHRGTTFLQHPYAVLLPPRPPTLRLPGNLPRVPAANTRHLLDQPTPRPTNELSNSPPLLSLSLFLEFVRSFRFLFEVSKYVADITRTGPLCSRTFPCTGKD